MNACAPRVQTANAMVSRHGGSGTPRYRHANTNGRTYPALANGRLYIRDLGTLWCYDVRAGK